MATKGKPETRQPKADPLASPAGRAWLEAQRAAAERDVTLGPGGGGWMHNEGLREQFQERLAFLTALIERAET